MSKYYGYATDRTSNTSYSNWYTNTVNTNTNFNTGYFYQYGSYPVKEIQRQEDQSVLKELDNIAYNLNYTKEINYNELEFLRWAFKRFEWGPEEMKTISKRYKEETGEEMPKIGGIK